ncbi:MAG: cytochrome c-type biogenesis protein CcmH [Alphaproteobacteria bacterium]
MNIPVAMGRRLARLMTAAALCVCLAGLLVPGAGAVQPDEILDDPVLESRARQIGKGLRCLVCQNQSIDDSDAPLAADLRKLVRERLEAGDSNAEAVDFVVDRYGEFVLLKPPFSVKTYGLWFGPFLVLAAGVVALWLWRRQRRRAASDASQAVAPLSAEEEARLRRLIQDDAPGPNGEARGG